MLNKRLCGLGAEGGERLERNFLDVPSCLQTQPWPLMFCNWSAIRLRAFHLPARPPLICAVNSIFLDLKFRLGLCRQTFWRKVATFGTGVLAGKNQVAERVSTGKSLPGQVLLCVFCGNIHFTFSVRAKKPMALTQLKTRHFCTLRYMHVSRRNETPLPFIVVCPKEFSVSHANFFCKRIEQNLRVLNCNLETVLQSLTLAIIAPNIYRLLIVS